MFAKENKWMSWRNEHFILVRFLIGPSSYWVTPLFHTNMEIGKLSHLCSSRSGICGAIISVSTKEKLLILLINTAIP
uniref:Uncharacterized protein n=1 Tax=Arundo donax TaxID=35708 RepID=A0A0A9C899_ARUDO